MFYKHVIPVVLVLMVVGLVIGCGGPATQPDKDTGVTEESMSPNEEGALESSMDMKMDLMKKYIDSSEETLTKLDEKINMKKEEAAQLEEDARITVEQHLELVQEKREKVNALLNEMKYDMDEMIATMKSEGSETVGEVTDTFYTEFEQKKEALEKAMSELENTYNEAFPNGGEGNASE